MAYRPSILHAVIFHNTCKCSSAPDLMTVRVCIKYKHCFIAFDSKKSFRKIWLTCAKATLISSCNYSHPHSEEHNNMHKWYITYYSFSFFFHQDMLSLIVTSNIFQCLLISFIAIYLINWCVFIIGSQSLTTK